MKLTLFAVFVIFYVSVAQGTLLQCLQACERYLNPLETLNCKRTCYKDATLGGYKTRSLDGCKNYCLLVDIQYQADCFAACHYLFGDAYFDKVEETTEEAASSSSNRRKKKTKA